MSGHDLGTLAVIANAFGSFKYFWPLLFLCLGLITTAISGSTVYRQSLNDLRAQYQNQKEYASERASTQTRLKKIVSNKISLTGDSRELDHKFPSVDLFTKDLVNFEPDGDLSIVATLSQFDEYGAVQPTILLSESDIEVIRPEHIDRIDNGKFYTHEVTSVEPLEEANMNSIVVFMVRHTDLFHDDGAKIIVKHLSNLRSVFSRLVGAQVSIALYIVSGEKPLITISFFIYHLRPHTFLLKYWLIK